MDPELCTIDPHDCLQKETIGHIREHINAQERFNEKIFNGYQEHEIKAVIDFLVSLGRMFAFFRHYKIFASMSILLILSAVSGVGLADVIAFLKLKGLWP